MKKLLAPLCPIGGADIIANDWCIKKININLLVMGILSQNTEAKF